MFPPPVRLVESVKREKGERPGIEAKDTLVDAGADLARDGDCVYLNITDFVV